MPKAPVVVVEDDLDIRETVVQLLEDEGYVVFAAEHGASALSQLRGIDPPCVVLLDLFMPVLDGKGFLDRLEEELVQHATRSKVVLLTAAPNGDALLAQVSPRVMAVLKKPFRVEELLAVVATAGKRTTL